MKILAVMIMLLGSVGILLYIDILLPMNETWDLDQSLAAFFLTVHASLLCIGGMMLVSCR